MTEKNVMVDETDLNPSSDGLENKNPEQENAKTDNVSRVPSHRLKEESDKRRELETKLAEYEAKMGEVSDAEEKLGEMQKYQDSLAGIVDAQLEEFKANHGEEKYEELIQLLWTEDVLERLEKLPKFVSLFEGAGARPVGGSGMPKGMWTQGRLDELKGKLKAGEALSASEKREYIALLK